MKEDEKKENKPCCTGPSKYSSDGKDEQQNAASCCGSGGDNKSPASIIKSIIFFVVVIAAIAMAAQAILVKDEKLTCEPGDSQVICGMRIESLNMLGSLAGDKDFVFLLIPGDNRDESRKAASVVEKTSEIITEQGTSVGMFTIKKESGDYKRLIKRNKIDSFPAVFVLSKRCGSEMVMGDITEERLMEAFSAASKVRSSCCP